MHKNKFISEAPLAERGLRPPISHGGKASHERLMLSISEVGFLLGIGRTSVYGLIKRGDLRAQARRPNLVPTEDVLRFAAELSARRMSQVGESDGGARSPHQRKQTRRARPRLQISSSTASPGGALPMASGPNWMKAGDTCQPGPVKTPSAVDSVVVEGHLTGGVLIGVYLFPEGDDRVRFAVLDIDNHDGGLGWQESRHAPVLSTIG